MNINELNSADLVEINEIKLDKFGCDNFGHYWGVGGLRLWNALGATIDLHIRAESYEGAKRVLSQRFPTATVFNGV